MPGKTRTLTIDEDDRRALRVKAVDVAQRMLEVCRSGGGGGYSADELLAAAAKIEKYLSEGQA